MFMNFKSIGIVVTLVLTMFMAAIESSIISLAMPTIRTDLKRWCIYIISIYCLFHSASSLRILLLVNY